MILAVEEKTFLEHCPLNLEGISLQFLNNYNVLDESIKGMIELFLLECVNKGRNGSVYVNNLVSLLATHYIQNYSNYFDIKNSQLIASKFDQRQMDRVDAYIADNIGSNISVDDLADLLGCSKFYFYESLKNLLA
ncbi:probable transcription regulator [Vibrio maritimus]|uniref:Probable transcription regulator n=1 Tax=Vibrio maritimus TaxID=990268 RepID=A0A090TB28_9VIBR|nr:probable transcription regulator [Vibrio maritimus]